MIKITLKIVIIYFNIGSKNWQSKNICILSMCLMYSIVYSKLS